MHQSYMLHLGSCGLLKYSWSFSAWQASNATRLLSGFSSQKQLNFGPCAPTRVTSADDGAKFPFIFSNSTECFNEGGAAERQR